MLRVRVRSSWPGGSEDEGGFCAIIFGFLHTSGHDGPPLPHNPVEGANDDAPSRAYDKDAGDGARGDEQAGFAKSSAEVRGVRCFVPRCLHRRPRRYVIHADSTQPLARPRRRRGTWQPVNRSSLQRRSDLRPASDAQGLGQGPIVTAGGEGFAPIVLDLSGNTFQAQVKPTVSKRLPDEVPMRYDQVGATRSPASGRGFTVDDEGVRMLLWIHAQLAQHPIGIGAQVVSRAGPRWRQTDVMKGGRGRAWGQPAHRGKGA